MNRLIAPAFRRESSAYPDETPAEVPAVLPGEIFPGEPEGVSVEVVGGVMGWCPQWWGRRRSQNGDYPAALAWGLLDHIQAASLAVRVSWGSAVGCVDRGAQPYFLGVTAPGPWKPVV